ncbi:MAG: HAD hydrolase-like protein [Streptosporangiales bacterium]|nr:HAD hydrolase-like protein [Streptosporangiales bacterium]
MHAPAPVGFDLDLTLIDSRRAIMASFAATAEATGVAIDPAGVESRLGIKLEDELSHWFAPGAIGGAVEIYRAHYARVAAGLTEVLPGAAAALDAVRASGARAVVITAKYVVPARAALEATGLNADDLFTERHGPEKAEVLAEIGAGVYVGDTPADMAAARAAGAAAVGVATGAFSADTLTESGADVVLASLLDFPAWYGTAVSGAGRG